MASLFATYRGLAREQVEAVFGEVIILHPRTRSQFSDEVADPDRPARRAMGVFNENPDAPRIMASRTRGSASLGEAAATVAPAMLSIAADRAAALGYPIRKGDLVTLTQRTGAPVFQVSEPPQVDDLGGVNLALVRWEGKSP